jgi:hypothetical protein
MLNNVLRKFTVILLYAKFHINWDNILLEILLGKENIDIGTTFLLMFLYIYIYIYDGFGGLEVVCWHLVPKFAGSNPAETVGFLRAKKSSVRLPSEGK